MYCLNVTLGWGDDSVNQGFTVQAPGPDFKFPELYVKLGTVILIC